MSGSELVILRNGPVVPLAPLQLLWTLEGRGLHFRLDGGDIVVNPRERLTDADRALLRRWKRHVTAILGYCDSHREMVQ